MPDPKTYKQHFENKHPKNDMPEELKEVWWSFHFKLNEMDELPTSTKHLQQ